MYGGNKSSYINKPAAALVWMVPCFKRVEWQNVLLRKRKKHLPMMVEQIFNKVVNQLVFAILFT